jgi:hypothetical protein
MMGIITTFDPRLARSYSSGSASRARTGSLSQFARLPAAARPAARKAVWLIGSLSDRLGPLSDTVPSRRRWEGTVPRSSSWCRCHAPGRSCSSSQSSMRCSVSSRARGWQW